MDKKQLILLKYKSENINYTVVYLPYWHGDLKQYLDDPFYTVEYIDNE